METKNESSKLTLLERFKTVLGIICYLLGICYYALSIARHIQF
jgi:hypothetical protein